MRIIAVIKKEIEAIKNDKKSLFIVFFPPLLQIFVFSFSITLEVKDIDLALLSHDSSSYSRQIIEKLEGSKYIKNIISVKNINEGKKLIDSQEVIAFLILPENLAMEKKINIILDGRRSNSALIANGYIELMAYSLSSNSLYLEIRNLYNPNLDNFWWIVPNLFGSITMIVALILTSLSIAREKELGTFDQILVSPLYSFEILLGKLLPALFLTMLTSTLVIIISIFLYEIPLLGSIWLLYFGVFIFLFCICSIGLFISSFSQTQQQAFIGAFIFILPSFMLSGFATAIENMPLWLQPVSKLIPLNYYIVFIKGVFLKKFDFYSSLEYLIPMLVLGLISSFVTLLFFRYQQK